jgi:hypothetical protein
MCSLPGLAPTARSHELCEILTRCDIVAGGGGGEAEVGAVGGGARRPALRGSCAVDARRGGAGERVGGGRDAAQGE